MAVLPDIFQGLQLATEKVMIRLPKTSRGKTTIENFHAAEVLEKYQVTPPQIIELKALMGDSADNIPGIPGSIGGGLYMNAGAYKDNLANHLIDVCVLKDNTICWMKKDELDYAYRHSIFQSHKDWTILVGRFQLEKGNQNDIRDLMNSRRERRMSAQPLDKPCAGSVFRNPEEIPAWKLIEELGLRGHKIGGAMVSEKHCNFIVNDDLNATAQDVRDLIHEIKTRAKKEYNIDMVTEVEQLYW